MIVDDGILDRGHRHNIFNPKFTEVGIAAGFHKIYEVFAVLDYIGITINYDYNFKFIIIF